MRSLLLLTCCLMATAAQAAPRITVSFPDAVSHTPLDGRIILLLGHDSKSEPRTQVSPDEPLKSPFIFGQTVEGMKPEQKVELGQGRFGWPARSLAALKPGDYIVQVVLNRYELFKRAALAGMSRATFDATLADQGFRNWMIQQQAANEAKYQIDSTPSFIINGHKSSGEMTFDTFDKLVATAAG